MKKKKRKKLHSNIFYCFHIITSAVWISPQKRMEVVFNNSETAACNIGKQRTIVNFQAAESSAGCRPFERAA